jgi:hypothetical protein
VKKVGSKCQKQANQLGLTQLRLTTLYAHSKTQRLTYGKSVPDTADIVRDLINLEDTTFIQDRAGNPKDEIYYYLSQKAQIYVEIFHKLAGFNFKPPTNNVNKINIFCNNEGMIRKIAQTINNVFEDGMLAHLDWKRFEEKYKVKAEDITAEWKKWL